MNQSPRQSLSEDQPSRHGDSLSLRNAKLALNCCQSHARRLVDCVRSLVLDVFRPGCDKYFAEDLESIKNEYDSADLQNVLYIGSSNDTSVRNIFPHTLHVDCNCPGLLPDDFRFVQGDIRNMADFQGGSTDLIVLKFLDYGLLEEPIVAQEISRMLSEQGKLVNFGNITCIDFDELPQCIEDVVEQNRSIRILKNLLAHGLVPEKACDHGTVVFRRGEMDEELLTHLEQVCTRNRHLFYQFVIMRKGKLLPFYVSCIMGLPGKSFRNISELQDYLKDIKSEAPEEAYRIIEKTHAEIWRL